MSTALSPLAVDYEWVALDQTWRGKATTASCRPGWARIRWEPSLLHYDMIFLGDRPANRARRLNEPTWELGDVCEIFVRVKGEPNYLEIHVTPENQRLQLIWPPGGLARLRRNEAALNDFCVTQPDWVQSEAQLGPGFWAIRVTIPADRLGSAPLAPGLELYSAVCRYEYDGENILALSSTAPLQEASFHRCQEWSRVVLIHRAASDGSVRDVGERTHGSVTTQP